MHGFDLVGCSPNGRYVKSPKVEAVPEDQNSLLSNPSYCVIAAYFTMIYFVYTPLSFVICTI